MIPAVIPQVIQYLTDENRYTQQKLQAAAPLREALYEDGRPHAAGEG